jgi:hypothetical protein
VEKPADVYVLPQLERLCAPEYKKWARPVMVYTIKSIAGSWRYERMTSVCCSGLCCKCVPLCILLFFAAALGCFMGQAVN